MSYRRVQSGDRISEYVLRDKLGMGGFGEVWKAEHAQIPGKFVAIKIPTTHESMVLLEAEAVSQHRLDHPNIVHTIGLNTDHDPPYFVMEYVEGRNLRRVMIDDGILPPPYAIDIAVQVLEALSHAHTSGIIHKDIKPENILVEKKRVRMSDHKQALLHMVKITDFGFGKIPDRTKSEILVSDMSRTSGVRLQVGTLFYAAPEQMVPGRRLDPRCDIYSVGIVLYEMLTGELPMGMDLPSELNPVVPPSLDRVCKRALSVDRDRRYATAAEMVADLHNAKETLLQDLNTGGAPPVSTSTNPSGQTHRRRGVLEGVLTVLVLSLLTLFALSSKKREPVRETDVHATASARVGPLTITVSGDPASVEFDERPAIPTPAVLESLSHERHLIRLKRALFEDRVLILEPRLIEGRPAFAVIDREEGRELFVGDIENGMRLENLALRPQRSTLVIDVPNVPDVAVYIDGDLRDRTQCTLTDLPAGVHRIRLEKPGYHTLEQEVLLAGNMTIHKEITLTPSNESIVSAQDTMLSVEFNSNPPGAELFINEETKGTTPVMVELPAGTYTVRLLKAYYAPIAEQITLKLGDRSSTFRLDPLMGSLSLETTPAGASVMIDGAPAGTTPLVDRPIRAGLHEIALSREGHLEKSLSVEVSDKPLRLSETLLKLPPAILNISSELAGVEIFIDDILLGRLPVSQAILQAGRHRIRVLGTEREIELDSGKERTVQLGLADLGLVRVEPGAFVFGSRNPLPGEVPQKTLTLPAFYMDDTEVTNEEYSLFLRSIRTTKDHTRCLKNEPAGDHTPEFWSDDSFNAPQQPVVGINYFDACSYAAWAGKRLPTEMEWEKAARGPRGFTFPWGNDWNPDLLNAKHFGRGHDRPVAVKSYPAGRSPYDCFEMAGNVSEWTSTRYESQLDNRIIRGGDFIVGQHFTTTFARTFEPLTRRARTIGFRCVVDAPKP